MTPSTNPSASPAYNAYSYAPAGWSPDQSALALTELAQLHQNLLATGNLILSGASSSSASPNVYTPTEVVSRPWIEPPDGFISFDQQGGISLDAPGTGFEIVVSMQVPLGFDGVINGINCNFQGGGFTEFSGDIVWQITRGGAAVRNYDNIQNEKGTPETARPIAPIRVFSGQIFQFLVNHVSNVALNGQVICGFVGYFYPSKG